MIIIINVVKYSDLDETHLFVTSDCRAFLKEKLADLMNDNAFPIGVHD